MTYPYGLRGAPAVGNGLPGLPQRGSGIAEEYEQTHFLVEGDTFDAYNTVDVTVPDGVYLISSMTVVGGGGAGSSTQSTATQYAGNGGNLRWMQDVSVAPGDVVTLVAAGGRSPAADSANRVGLVSEIRVNGIVVLRSSSALSDAVRGANGGLGGGSNFGATLPRRGAGGGGAGGHFLEGGNSPSGGAGGAQGEGAGGGGALIIGLNKPGASMPTTTRSMAGTSAPVSGDLVHSIPGGKGAALDLASPFKSDFTIIAGGKNGQQTGSSAGLVRGNGGAYGGGGGGPGQGNRPGYGGMGAASVTFVREVKS